MSEGNSYTLYTGCLIDRRFPAFEIASRKVLGKLNIKLEDAEGFTCCPDPVWVRSLNERAWFIVAGRNLSIAEEKGNPLLTLCNGCYETLNTANIFLKGTSDKANEIKQKLKDSGIDFKGSIEVTHIVRLLYEVIGVEEIKKYVKKSLNGLKVAVHPGCHLTRPSTYAKFDNPLNPQAMDEILKVIGATVVDYPEKTACCGLPIFASSKDTSIKMALKKINSLKDKVDAMVVSCPSCYLQFETAQILTKVENPLPIFYIAELVSIAFGDNPEELALEETHRIKLNGVLEKIGVISHA